MEDYWNVEAAPEVVSGIGYQQVPTLQPVEAASVYTAPTSGPSDFYASTYVAPAWSPGMDPTLRPGWKPDEAGMAELGAWLQSSPNSILNSPLYPTTVPQAAQDYIKEQAALGKTLIYDPATEAALGSALSPFISTGVSYKPFDPNNPMANMGQVFRFTTDGNEPNAPVVFQPGQTYSLYDYKGENLLGQAKTPEELQALIDLSNQRQAQGWTLKGDNVPDYAGGGFGTGSAGGIYARAPQDNTGKMIMLAALTAMGAGALGPFIQGAGAIAPGLTGAAATPLGAGLAAAGVNTVGNLATGASLGDALKSGALAGLSTAAMSGLLGELSGAPKSTPNVGDLQAAAIDTADLLTGLGVNPTLAGQIASGPISGIGSVGSGLAGSAPTVVIGNPGAAIGSVPASSTGALAGAGLGAVTGATAPTQPVVEQPAPSENQIDVIADYNATVPPAYSPSVPFDVAFSPDYFPAPTTEAPIVVEATQPPPPPPAPTPVVIPPVSGIGNPEVVVTATQPPPQPEQTAPVPVPPVVTEAPIVVTAPEAPPPPPAPEQPAAPVVPPPPIVVEATVPQPAPEQPAPPPFIVPPPVAGIGNEIVVEATQPAAPPAPEQPAPVVAPPVSGIGEPEIVVEATQPTPPPEPEQPAPVIVPPPPVSGIGQPEIVVEATKPAPPPEPEQPAPVIVPPTTPTEIVVEGEVSKPVQDEINRQETVVPPLNSVDIPANAGDVTPKKGLSTLDYIRMGLLAPKLIGGIADLLGGEDNTVITPDQSRVNYNPLNREKTVSGIGAAPFDVFTYGQNKPGAQQSEYAFFRPYTTSIGQQAYTPVSSYDRYTQADVDAANAAAMQAYNTQLGNFNTYQDTLAQQVGAGAVTPEQAQALAQQYATGLGYEATAAKLKEGGEAEGDGEMSDEMVRHLIEWNKGNGHKGPGHVRGIGSGQEDLIPAWLSDGEYVWSAQDVADLGDGSTDEGVRRLDKMRQMVRGRAGRKDVKKIAKPQQGIEAMLKAVGGKV